ncbi:hypothetical protein [Nocardioides sp. GY 10127]|uniref:hypothetical protein n=1 Tax=Nocardioides sp. GY 10127 TaxID=2569762 RepID=UPI00145825B4|nr:hypothetical protein [Nocardioides sp. GY 10127]
MRAHHLTPVLCLALLLLAACGGGTSSGSPSPDSRWGADATVRLVRADGSGAGDGARLAEVAGGPGHAGWEASSSTLAYASEIGYSGSCAPTARLGGTSEDPRLVLRPFTSSKVLCTADAVSWVVVVTGLEDAPGTLLVTDLSGGTSVQVSGVD